MASIGTPVTGAVEVFMFDPAAPSDFFTYVQNWAAGKGANVGATYVSGAVDGAGNATCNLGSYGWLTVYPYDFAIVTGYTINVQGAFDFPSLFRSLAPTIALGIADIPLGLISIGGTKTVTVDLSPGFLDTNYTARGKVVGAPFTLLGQLELTSTTIVSRSQVSCVVTNKALVAVTVSTGSVEVLAQHA